jgi:3D (Asp-Asp-Asp) domain-containing protein
MTAYTQYHNPPQRTASGTLPAVGRTVAVDPRVIPLGTRLHIEGVGIRIAEDTGKKIKGKKLDLFLSSIGACTRFGVRSRQVYILD